MDEPSPRILDGYRLIRFLGSGGFGEVWLCRSEAMGDLHAIKLVLSSRSDRLKREHESLLNYRAVAGLRSPHLVPIEHINWYEDGLCYVMPLADGTGGDGPEDPGWQPLGLDLLIEAQRGKKEWFTAREIVEMLRPVLLALQTLSEAKLVHRDVKPANILFFGGSPRLGDVSLLGEDAVTVTRRGTPGYAAPSWYEGGHPDLYSAAATLYTLLTGNPPDKMGRAAFLWPPQGEDSLSEAGRGEWKRLHAVVRRATDERICERYLDFAAMLAAVEGGETSPPLQEATALPEFTQEQDYHALMADLLELGDFEGVVESINDIFTYFPQAMVNPRFSLDRATALIGLDRIDEAEEELRRLIHVHPSIVWMQPRIELWESIGKIEEAEASQTLILETCGPTTMALLFRAEVRARRGNYAGVEADRQAALPLNSYAPDDQKRFVDTLWSELERKYPGYLEYRTELLGVDGRPDAEEAHNDEWVLAVTEVIADELTPEGTPWAGWENEGRNYLRAALIHYFEKGDYSRALVQLDQRVVANPPRVRPLVAKTYLLSLYRALVLKRLGRREETERELESRPLPGILSPRQAAACAAVLDALGRQAEAEELLTGMMESLLSGEGESVLSDRVSLHALRARIRAIQKDYPGARNDHEAALNLAVASTASRPSESAEDEDHPDLRAWVEKVRNTFREKFPAYTAYEKSLSAEAADTVPRE